LIPPFLEDGGAMGGILAARLSSMLHLGLTEYNLKPPWKIIHMFLLVHLLGIPVFTLVAVFASIVSQLMNIHTIPFLLMLTTTIAAGEILITIINFLTYYASVLSFKKGIDPDNVTIPIITSVVDLLGVICFITVLIATGIV
ncbi:MAG TPA: magnesium transporter, partial [Thermoplasmatales archaeon]|nr:magnesium transporter [Thermoplasmatales archaeon]